MPSFDVVSEVDLQEVDNAVNQVAKEIKQRFDFRGSDASVDWKKSEKTIQLTAEDEMKLRALRTMLTQRMAKRDVDARALDFGKEEGIGGRNLRQKISLQVGLSKENAKKLTKAIKETGLKVQAAIQDDQVRVTGKKIDDLQSVIAALKSKELDFPVQFINMRS